MQGIRNEAYKKQFAYEQMYNLVKGCHENIEWRSRASQDESYSEDTRLEYILEIEVLSDIIAYLSKF